MFSAFFKACSLSRTSLLYRMPSSLSTTFFNFFEAFFCPFPCEPSPHFTLFFCCLRLPDSLIILPKILPLVNGFLHLFLPFFDFFFTWILRSFAGEGPGRALPFANTCFVAFAENSSRTAEQRKYRRPAIHYIIMYENLGSGSESLQKSGFFHIPHTCPTALWYIIVRNGRKKYGQIKNDIKG